MSLALPPTCVFHDSEAFNQQEEEEEEEEELPRYACVYPLGHSACFQDP
jgi:hypothetical protein